MSIIKGRDYAFSGAVDNLVINDKTYNFEPFWRLRQLRQAGTDVAHIGPGSWLARRVRRMHACPRLLPWTYLRIQVSARMLPHYRRCDS